MSDFGGRSGLDVWAENKVLVAQVAELQAELDQARKFPSGRLEDLSQSRRRLWVENHRLAGEIARLTIELQAAREAIVRVQESKGLRGTRHWRISEPDFLIDADGVRWDRVGSDEYSNDGYIGFRPDREKLERSGGPLTEGWKQ